jgi:hypothetical protein
MNKVEKSSKDNSTGKKGQDYFYYKSLLESCNVLDDLDSKTIVYGDNEEIKNFLRNVDDVELLDETIGDISVFYSPKIKEKYNIGPFLFLKWDFVVDENNMMRLKK